MKFCVIPIAMPASIPSSKTTTLTHIINDPIIGLSLFVLDFTGRPAERGAHVPSSSL
jgi:hypothetical protein